MVEKANNFDVQFERILKATGSSSDAELARKLGISPPSVTGAKQRRSIPLTWLKTVAEVYGASLDWLMTGKGKPQPLMALAKAMERRAAEISEEMPGQADYLRSRLRQEGFPDWQSVPGRSPQPFVEEAPPRVEKAPQPDVDMIFVPLVEACLSAGSGSLETSADSERRYAFRSDFLHRKGNPDAMVLMRVSGDSMEPEIKNGDVVLLDQSKQRIMAGRFYAVGFEDAIYIKQIDMLPGKVVLRSLNITYPPVELDVREDLATQFRVVGQVLWVGWEYH